MRRVDCCWVLAPVHYFSLDGKIKQLVTNTKCPFRFRLTLGLFCLFPRLTAAESWELFRVARCTMWLACRRELLLLLLPQSVSRLAELLKFIPLCILQYPPFFLPLPKQQATRHLGCNNSSPKQAHKPNLFTPCSLAPHIAL